MSRVGGRKAKVRVEDSGQGSPEILKRTRLQTKNEKEKNIKYGFAGGGKDPRLDYAKIRRQQIRENMKLLKKNLDAAFPDEETYIKMQERGLDDFELNGKKYLAEEDKQISTAAVNFFNKKHSADYELVETLGSFVLQGWNGLWYHCNFKAKSKKRRPSEPRPPSPDFFFAELFHDGNDGYTVSSCNKLDASCRLVGGCQVCPKPIQHPFGKFKIGGGDVFYTSLKKC